MMKKTSFHQNQTGLVSFLVVMMLMVVITLIVLSFAQIMRREQRQTLDRQLNTQAFYAAEAGVNDAFEALSNAPAGSALFTTDYTSDCNDFIADAGLNSSLGGGTVYSCLLVDTSPPQLRYSSVPPSESIAMPIRPAPDATGTINPINRIEITWEDANTGDNLTTLTGCSAVGQFPAQWSSSCELGMLRIEFVPFNGSASRTTLIDTRSIAFVHPVNVGGNTTYAFATSSGDNQGHLRGASCTPATGRRRCTMSIDNINAVIAGGVTNGYMRIRSLYRTHAVTIRAFSTAGQVDLAGAQAEIDATGRAEDVLKRIKVNAPIVGDDTQYPEFALQTGRTQCKRLEVIPNSSFANVGWFNPSANNSPCNPWQTIVGDG